MIENFESPEHRFLSNFYPYLYGGEMVPEGPQILQDQASRLWGYPTMENFYQAMKINSLRDRGAFKLITTTAGQAKRMGQRVTLRPDWEENKNDVMFTGLMRKFAAGTKEAELLLLTGSEMLIEGNNWHNTYWGRCNCGKHQFPGNNHLGILLMEVRDELVELQ